MLGINASTDLGAGQAAWERGSFAPRRKGGMRCTFTPYAG